MSIKALSIRARIHEDLKKAMLAKDELTRDTLRMVKAAMTNRELELGRDLTEADELDVLGRGVKSRKDSIQSYEEGGRTDAADQERAEIEVIQRYLPQQMSEDELREAAAAIATELGLSTRKQMGQLMKELMARHRGRFDGKLASKIAGSLLS